MGKAALWDERAASKHRRWYFECVAWHRDVSIRTRLTRAADRRDYLETWLLHGQAGVPAVVARPATATTSFPDQPRPVRLGY